jgi:hypothetical protein
MVVRTLDSRCVVRFVGQKQAQRLYLGARRMGLLLCEGT